MLKPSTPSRSASSTAAARTRSRLRGARVLVSVDAMRSSVRRTRTVDDRGGESGRLSATPLRDRGRNGPMPATRRATDGICRRVAALFHPKKDSSVDAPRTKYAKTPDGVYLAYQTVGDGPIDIVWQFDWLGNVDTIWEYRPSAEWFRGLASFSRLILHDRRGTGASSRNVDPPNL